MKKVPEKNRAVEIISRLKRRYPEAKIALRHSKPLELMVATILSAQCTDERVNIVTKELFKHYKGIGDYAKADLHKFEESIKSTGFYRAKARNIINCCKTLAEKYQGEIPDSMESLITLPGIGRKTANVILGGSFGKAEGIVVDTHVKRLSGRLKLSAEKDPEKIEKDLMEQIPKKNWIETGNLLIRHGRKTCSARKPKCTECNLADLCPSAGDFA